MKRQKLTHFAYTLVIILLMTACSAKKSDSGPSDVADSFVQAYYVEANLQGALDYCVGLACQKIKQDLALREGQEITADTFQPEIIATQTKVLDEAGGAKRYLYKLEVKPKEMEPFEREAYVKLRQAGDQWKVSQFAEIPMTSPGESRPF